MFEFQPQQGYMKVRLEPFLRKKMTDWLELNTSYSYVGMSNYDVLLDGFRSEFDSRILMPPDVLMTLIVYCPEDDAVKQALKELIMRRCQDSGMSVSKFLDGIIKG